MRVGWLACLLACLSALAGAQQTGGSGVPGAGGGTLSGAAGGSLTGSYPNPGLSAAAVASGIAGQTIVPKLVNGIAYSTNYSGATVDARVNACLADAVAQTNGNTTGVCDASAETGRQTSVSEIDVGNSTGTGVKLLLPCDGVWQGSMTDGTSSVIKQYGGSTVMSECPSSGPSGQMVFTTTSGSNLGYVYQTATSNNGYLYAQGFNVINVSGGHATASGIGFYLNGPLYDATTLDEVNVYDSLDAHPAEVYQVCCSTTWKNSSVNAGYNGTPLLLKTDSGGFTQAFTMRDSSVVHPGAGLPAIDCEDSSSNTNSTVSFEDIYTETGSSGSSAIYKVNGCSAVNFAHILLKAYQATDTSPGIEIFNAYPSFVTVDDLKFRVGSGAWTLPAVAVKNDNASATATLYTDTAGNFAHYNSPTGPASFGTVSATTLTATGLGTSTSPVCPNGSGGALTTSGCAGTGGGVASVANSDGTLTTSPTTGAVVPSLNLGHANTWTATATYAAAGAASTPGLAVTGAPYTGGTATTDLPQFYVNDGAAVTTLSTAGTAFGINAPSGFSGHLINLFVNGGSTRFRVDYAGDVFAAGTGTIAGALTAASLAATGTATNTYLGSGTASNTDLTGILSAAGSSVSYSFQRSTAYGSHPICMGAAEGTTPVTYAVSYTGVASVTFTFGASFTGNWDYACVARN